MLGHELTHIRNGDVRMLVIAVIIAGVIAFFAELVFRLMFQGGLRWRRPLAAAAATARAAAGIAILIAVALIAVAWLLSIVIRFALSRQREYLADAGSVELTKNPDAMISALRKIEGRGELQGATSAVMEMCIDNPREGFADLFDTHPSIESADRGAGQVRRRPRSGAARAAGAGAGRCGDEPQSGDRSPPPADRGAPRRSRNGGAQAVPAVAAADRARRLSIAGQRARPVGTAPEIATLASPGWLAAPRNAPSVPLERDQRAHRHVELAQLVGAAELRQVDDEAGGEHLGAQLAQQLDRALGGAAGRDQVVHQDDALALAPPRPRASPSRRGRIPANRRCVTRLCGSLPFLRIGTKPAET